jgi:hypothetical protein
LADLHLPLIDSYVIALMMAEMVPETLGHLTN